MDMTSLQLSLSQFFRTGSIIVDFLIAMMIPVLFKALFQDGMLQKVLDWVVAMLQLRSKKKEAFRSISYVSVGQSISGRDQKNHVLQKAVALYLSHLGIEFEEAEVSLESTKSTGRCNYDADPFMRSKDPLKEYRVTRSAARNKWESIGNKIWFQQRTSQEGEGDNTAFKRELIIFEFKCSATDGHERIDSFVDEAMAWYRSELAKLKDESRYMYAMANPTGRRSEQEEVANVVQYKRYKLSDEKTFESLFFKEKQDLLQILDNFQQKKGRYAISGMPHKLGLLLHGPPGTGKTSLIKALAQATQRSIVSVNLSRIETNQQLMDMLFELKCKVAGEDMPVNLSFKDVIFVLEDVDAASSIVHSRVPSRSIASVGPPPPPPPPPSKKQGKAKAEDEEADGTSSSASPKASASQSSGPKTREEMVCSMEKPDWWKEVDELNLSGLLNVLDGVVDCPERILVMTSNHPEKLDPALIRPGRIDKKIFLGYMQQDQAAQMIAHYLQATFTAEQHRELTKLFAFALSITPALLESFCAELRLWIKCSC